MKNATFEFMDPANQFVEIAPDCVLKEAIIPLKRNDKKTIATIEYELLALCF